MAPATSFPLPNVRWILVVCFTLSFLLVVSKPATAQITTPRVLSATPDRFATLEEQLINRLRATAEDQKAYIQFVVNKVRENQLDVKLVVAIQQYAMKRNPNLPFLYFERALKVEAGKRGVNLPPVRQFATTSASSI
jgi:hypothetical protein